MKLTLTHTVVVVFSATALLAFGCSSSATSSGNGAAAGTDPTGSNTTTPGSGTSTSTSTQSLEVQMATAECNFSQRCGPVGFTTSYRDLADCVARSAKAYTKRLHATGTSGLDTQVPACTAAIAAKACGDSSPEPQCAFKGTVATGGACSFAGQCQSGWCFSATSTACGTCVEPLPLGGDCSVASCMSGLYCSADKKCTAYAKEGESCASTYCDASLSCSTTQNRTCVKYVAKGGSCAESFCDPELDCVDNVCVDQTVVKAGETCGYDESTGKTPACLDGNCRGLDDNFENGKCGAYGEEGADCDALKAWCSPELSCVAGKCIYGADQRVCN